MSPASGRSGASGESAGIAERGTSGIRDGAIGSGIAREAAARRKRAFRSAVVAYFGLIVTVVRPLDDSSESRDLLEEHLLALQVVHQVINRWSPGIYFF